MQPPPEGPIPPPPGPPPGANGGNGNGEGGPPYNAYPPQNQYYSGHPAHPAPPPPQAWPPPHAPMSPYGYYVAPNEGKAVTSLIFGVLSLFCLGILAGIPAIVLGLLAKRDIGRSGGALGGGGFANAGIALGVVSSLITVGTFAMMLIPLFITGFSAYSSSSASSSSTPTPPAYSAPSYTAPPATSANENESSTTITRGALRVIEPHRGSGSLERQLMDAFSHAKEKGRIVLVETAASASFASKEFDTSLTDRRMQRALSAVDIVRIDIEEFAPELAGLRMYTEAVPYFYKIDSAARPTDAISADEWDANVPQNMAPVLESFVAGTLRKRRSPSPLGTTL